MSDLQKQLAQDLEAIRLMQQQLQHQRAQAALALLSSAPLPPQPHQPPAPLSHSAVFPGTLRALQAADQLRSLQAQLGSGSALPLGQQLQFLRRLENPLAIAAPPLPVIPRDTLGLLSDPATVATASTVGATAGTFVGALVQDDNALATTAAATVGAALVDDVKATAAAAPKKKNRGGVSDPFPRKLHRVLSEVETDGGLVHVISWLPHGRAFAIRDPERFVSEIMPRHFRMSSLSSLQRQLNLYGFKRVMEGRDKGAYYHRLFLRGQPELTDGLKRTKAKRTFVSVTDANGGTVMVPRGLAALYEPNFYAMPSLTELDANARREQRQGDPTSYGDSLAAMLRMGRH